jgi:hypothetical protein
MLGIKSRQRRLRDRGGKLANAKILDLKRGTPSWKNAEHTTETTKLTFTLLVQTRLEAPFEAVVTARMDKIPVRDYTVGDLVRVVYDPADHSKVLMDEPRTLKIPRSMKGDRAAINAAIEAHQAAIRAEIDADQRGI